MEIDVLVVGAGPTGLLLAAELARHGVRPRLIERATSPSPHSKALAVHARTLELWDDLGVTPRALARGVRLHGMNLYAEGQRLAHLSFDELDSPHPYVLILPQSVTESLLAERAAELGVTVERGVELVALDPGDDAVRCTLRGPTGDAQVSSRWVIGCDGAHSTVRKQLDLPFAGADLALGFVFGDVTSHGDLADDEGHVHFAPDGVAAWIPLPEPGTWRVICGLPPGEPVPEQVTLETLQALVDARMPRPPRLSDPTWLTGFEVRQRKVERYRAGRVLLAGDAAHAHSPVGGQGMNTGLQDAYNLAWKLALVARGQARPALLDSYEAEREPVARSLLRDTERGTRAVSLRHPVAQAVRNHVASFLTSLDVVRHRLARGVGELSIHYRSSPIVDEDRSSLLDANLVRDPNNELPSVLDWRDFSSAPHPGDRAPDAPLGDGHRLYDELRGTAHVLLLFDGASATSLGYARMAAIADHVESHYGDRLRARLVIPHATVPPELEGNPRLLLDPDGLAHQAYGAGAECLYLIRPDGYVGYRSQPADANRLQAYLTRLLT